MDLGQVFTNKTVAEYMVSMFELGKDALICKSLQHTSCQKGTCTKTRI